MMVDAIERRYEVEDTVRGIRLILVPTHVTTAYMYSSGSADNATCSLSATAH